MTSKSQEFSKCDLCNVDLSSIQEQLEHDFSLIHHMKLHQKHKKLTHMCSLCFCEVGPIKSYVSHLHGSKHQKALKSRKEQWSECPPTVEDLSRRFHITQTERHQSKSRKSTSSRTTRENQRDNNFFGSQNFDRNCSNKFENTSNKNYDRRGGQNHGYHNYPARSHNVFQSHAPFRYGQPYFGNNSNRMQNNHNWRQNFHGNYNNMYSSSWNQPQFTEDPSFNAWDKNPQYGIWGGENFNWNNNCNTSQEPSILPDSRGSINLIPESTKSSLQEPANESVPQMSFSFNPPTTTSKLEKESSGRETAKRVRSVKIPPKPKKMANKKIYPVISEGQQIQNRKDISECNSENKDKSTATKMPVSDQLESKFSVDVSDTKVSNSDGPGVCKVNSKRKVKSETPGCKSTKVKGKKKAGIRHTYFLSSDSDSEHQRGSIQSDSSESAVDSSTAEVVKEESFNKALLNRLINFPCSRKQQVQLAKWIQEHSKLKKKLLFPRFNLPLSTPESDKTEEKELRKVLSEMMTELSGEAIDALVDVLKLDSRALPQEEVLETSLPEESGKQRPAQSEDFSALFQKEQEEVSRKEIPNEPDLYNISIKPDPDGIEFLNDEPMQSASHGFADPCGPERLSENCMAGSLTSDLHYSSTDSGGEFLKSAATESNYHYTSPNVNPSQTETNNGFTVDYNLPNTNPGLQSNKPGPEENYVTSLGNSTMSENHSCLSRKNLSSPSLASTLNKPVDSPVTNLTSYTAGATNLDPVRPPSLPNDQFNICQTTLDHQVNDAPNPQRNSKQNEVQGEKKMAESTQSVPESESSPSLEQSHEYSENFTASSSHNPSDNQKWNEMPSWFKSPTPEFFRADSPNSASGIAGSSAVAHSLVDRLLSLSKEEEKLREQSQKAEQVIGQMHKVLEEWKQKKSELQQAEIELRKQRVNLLEMLQGSLTNDGKVGSRSSTPKSDFSQEKEPNSFTATETSNSDQNMTYLGTLDSTWDIIQQLGLNMPSASDSNWFDSSCAANASKAKQKSNTKARIPKKNAGSEKKGKKTAKSPANAKSKKRKTVDNQGSDEAPHTKAQRKTKRKRNSAAEQANVLQDLLNHFVKRDGKSPKSRDKDVHERVADSTSEDAPSSSTQAGLGVIKTEPTVVDTFGPIETHGSAVLDIKVSNGFLYTCSSDKTAKRIEIKNPSKCVEFKGHEKTVSSIQLVSYEDGLEKIFTTSHDGYLRSFDLQTGHLLTEQFAGSSILCLTKGFGNLYLGLNNGQVWPYRISSGKFLDVFDFSHTSISRIAAGREGGQRVLCIVTYDGSVSIRNAISGLLIRLIELKVQPPCLLQIEGSEVFLTTTDRSIFVFDLTSGSLLKRILCVSAATGLYVIRNLMLVCSFDGFIRCYSRKNWSLHRVYYGAGKTMAMCLEVSDGWVYSGNRHGIVEAFKIDESVDATCWFLDCKTPFGQWKDLKHHLIADHMARVYPDSVATWSKCPWVNCKHLLKGNTGPEKQQELEDHILEHAEST